MEGAGDGDQRADARGDRSSCRDVDEHRKYLLESGELASRNRRILQMRILKAVEEIVRERLLRQNRDALEQLLDLTESRELDPYQAACQLLGNNDTAPWVLVRPNPRGDVRLRTQVAAEILSALAISVSP